MNERAFLDPCPGCTTQHLLGRLRELIEWAATVDHGRAVELDRVVASLELRWRGETSEPGACRDEFGRPVDPDWLTETFARARKRSEQLPRGSRPVVTRPPTSDG